MEEFNMNKMMMRKTLIASGVALAFGAPNAQAIQVPDYLGLGVLNWYTDRANFTMQTPNGYIVGGTNDVTMYWDGSVFTASSDYTGPGSASNVTASSTTPFFSYTWTAHDIQVFAPGSYSFDTTLGGGNGESGMLNATVGLTQMGFHMLFDWAGNLNIDVFVVASFNSMYGSGVGTTVAGSPCTASASTPVKNCLWTGKGWAGGNKANAPADNQTWMLATVDGDGDGIMGIPMAAGGPFGGFNAGFNATMAPALTSPVPVPAAAWLFGSGLLGLVGIARRRKMA
jgi:hypothetical protein